MLALRATRCGTSRLAEAGQPEPVTGARAGRPGRRGGFVRRTPMMSLEEGAVCRKDSARPGRSHCHGTGSPHAPPETSGLECAAG